MTGDKEIDSLRNMLALAQGNARAASDPKISTLVRVLEDKYDEMRLSLEKADVANEALRVEAIKARRAALLADKDADARTSIANAEVVNLRNENRALRLQLERACEERDEWATEVGDCREVIERLRHKSNGADSVEQSSDSAKT